MLRSQIERLFDAPALQYTEADHRLFQEFKDGLNRGEIRAAEPDPAAKSGWRANAWVKKGILLGFRMGRVVDFSLHGESNKRQLFFFDKSTYPVRPMSADDGVRLVPGGSSIRDGCYIARGVVCMPPMFINVGAYLDEQTMIDSHALVGSCAQIGRNCHISAGAQIGGVLEPVYTASESDPLVIPEEAVVVPGSRAVSHAAGAKWGLSLQCAVIVKYRDAKTDSRIQLEDLLR